LNQVGLFLHVRPDLTRPVKGRPRALIFRLSYGRPTYVEWQLPDLAKLVGPRQSSVDDGFKSLAYALHSPPLLDRRQGRMQKSGRGPW